MFEIQAINLDDVMRVTVGHDGDGAGDGWYLDKIIVRERGDKRSDKHSLFTCNRSVLTLI